MGSDTTEVIEAVGIESELSKVPPLRIHWLAPALEPMLRTTPVVLWDKDSTLADTSARQWIIDHIKADGKRLSRWPWAKPYVSPFTWDDYSLACLGDPVFPGAKRLMERLDGSHLNLIASGASAVATELTTQWVRMHQLPVDGMILRPDNVRVDNGMLKVAWVRQLQAMGVDVQLFFEDWEQAAKAIARHTSVPVLGVNPFYPEVNKEKGAWVPDPRFKAMERG